MLSNRIGTFFMLVGALLIGLYILSDAVDSPSCGFLITGGILVATGIFLWLRNPAAPPQETGRFRIFKSRQNKQGHKK